MKFFGRTSFAVRKALFFSYILPLFTWLYPVFPLFTDRQRSLLSHFYFTCLKRVLFCLGLNDFLFAYLFDELSFDDRFYRYWNRYLVALSDSVDRELIFERASLNCLRQSWVDREFSIKCLRVSKRFIDNDSFLERCMKWICSNSSLSSIPEYDLKEIQLLRLFPESFFPQSSSLFFSVCSCSALCFFMIIFLLHDIFHSVSCYTLGFTLCTPFFFMDILLVSFILDFGSSMFWFSFLSLILCFSFNYLTFC